MTTELPDTHQSAPAPEPLALKSKEGLGPDAPMLIHVPFGTVECRAWFEADMMPDGTLRLTGMGSRTDYDREGKLTAHKCKPTGVVAYWPAAEPRRSWLARVFGA